MYLEHGGYNEILNMCYWDFISILETAKIKAQREAGKPVIHEEVPQSNKDLINKWKEVYAK